MKKMIIIAGLLAASVASFETAQASVKSAKAAKAEKQAKAKAAAAKPLAATKPPASKPAVSKANVSRDIRFNGSQVDGKYLSAGESIAEVESDKEMAALIGIRKNFHDRLNEEKSKLQANSSQTASSGKGQ